MAAHPVEQAAYAHYALTVVHPFADGNGRVARALASVYLYRSLSIPLVVFASQRLAYLAALAAADQGDHGPWLAFVADRGIDTMQLIAEILRSAGRPQPDEVAERLDSSFSPRGRSHAELDNLALRLLAEAQTAWGQQIGRLRSRSLRAELGRGVSGAPAPAGYRRIGGGDCPAVIVNLATPPPAAFDVSLSFRVNIAQDDENPFGFQLEALGAQDHLDVRDTDVAPELSESLKLRLGDWVNRHLRALLEHLDLKSNPALKTYR
jgi:hypothetical protein